MRTKTDNPKTNKIAVKEKSPAGKPIRFPIVGIGASAGGLEALEQFLGNTPQKSGMAYVVIQHLDPTQKGMLPELLQRITPMEVFQVTDRMAVKPNSVYVIPPNKSMSLLNGRLHLFEPIEMRGMRLPIDFFLRSLADDWKELAVGVILSGMGSDGSVGLRSIKEKDGIVMVQDPSDAKFDNMPHSAIEAVVVDIVAKARELPVRLVEYLKHIPLIRPELEVEVKDKSSLEKIIILLRTYTGNDFSLYKKNTLYRRIERRMSVHKFDKIVTYVHFLQTNPKEVEILFKELLIGVTSFFRDTTVWESLKGIIIPDIISRLQPDYIVRAWVPGCSTGEEAYSLAMIFAEANDKIIPRRACSLQIFATDLDTDAIDFARKGLYPLNIAADVSAERLNRYFIHSDEGYRIKQEIREMVVFAPHNLILHPPFTRLDIVSCRNLLIYMDSELQKKLIGLFYYSLNNEGLLVLGSSETLGSQSHLFTHIDSKLKIYKRALTSQSPELSDFPSSFSRNKPIVSSTPMPERLVLNVQALSDQILLKNYTPPGVLVNEFGDIIYIHGHTGKYLEPAVGKANLNIFAMVRDGLRNDFLPAFRRVVAKKDTVVLHNVKIGTNGTTQTVNVEIKWIDKPELLYGNVLIIFTDVREIPEIHLDVKKGRNILTRIKQKEVEEELFRLREEMQNTLEEVQTSQEELRSTNEELQSTNEELQSTNEELTTSKEEMQSLNEELQTVNAELQAKVEDYARVNNDMKNLLNSTEIATLFLDKELSIRRFTHQATNIFKLIKSDIGRPFTDQVSDLIYPRLADDAIEVLRTLIFIQKEVPARDGRWFLIRIMPYRTFDDRIDGLVITFINISDQKRIEEKLFQSENLNRVLLGDSTEIKIVLSAGFDILEFNNEAVSFFGKKREACIEKNFIRLCIPEKLQKSTEKSLRQINKNHNEKLIIKVNVTNLKNETEECFVALSIVDLDPAGGMILSIKKQ